MMDKFRIMIIDDSVLMRMLLNKVIGTDAELEVIASVDNAERGISLIPKLNPDIITLDIEMPGMNGLNAVTEIRAKKYQVPIIMCSSLSLRGAEATIDALQRGANDFVTKPSSTSNTTYTFDEMAVELLYKIHALVKSQKKPSVISRQQSVLLCAPKDRIDVICIGISTGGPDALLTLLPKIPENFPIPIIIVQHMSALFTRVLAASLDKKCAILVKEAEDGEELMPGFA
jgi:two-component system chemotaxis response regulator CheB